MSIPFKSSIAISIFFLTIICPQKFNAQQCEAALFMKQGAKLEYTNYTKKGKKESSATHETLSVTGEQNDITATIKATIFDQKDKEIFTTNYEASCKNGVFAVDMLRFFNLSTLSQHTKNGLNINIDGDVLEFPSGMNSGSSLNDGTITIEVNNQDNTFTLVTLSFNVFNRKIEGEETITTPSGTYKCKKVTFDFASKFGIINLKGSGVEWYYNDAVVIKSESYNKKGKLIGYHQLTSIK